MLFPQFPRLLQRHALAIARYMHVAQIREQISNRRYYNPNQDL
jgi:hypothetical protein